MSYLDQFRTSKQASFHMVKCIMSISGPTDFPKNCFCFCPLKMRYVGPKLSVAWLTSKVLTKRAPGSKRPKREP